MPCELEISRIRGSARKAYIICGMLYRENSKNQKHANINLPQNIAAINEMQTSKAARPGDIDGAAGEGVPHREETEEEAHRFQTIA